MFREQAGFVAVFFLSGADHCAALSVWKDMAAVDAPAFPPEALAQLSKIG
jgi:hypothetical protein